MPFNSLEALLFEWPFEAQPWPWTVISIIYGLYKLALPHVEGDSGAQIQEVVGGSLEATLESDAALLLLIRFLLSSTPALNGKFFQCLFSPHTFSPSDPVQASGFNFHLFPNIFY